MNIAKVLKTRRKQLGISQDQLAQACGFAHRSNICRLETEKLEWKWRDVIRAARALDIQIEIKEKI